MIGEIAAELKLSRRKVLAVLDLWDAKCAEPSAERETFILAAKNKALSDLRGEMFLKPYTGPKLTIRR